MLWWLFRCAALGWVCAIFITIFGARGAQAADSVAKESTQKALGFSRLVFRSDDEWSVTQSDVELKIMILDYLRSKEVYAVGGEDLVFGKDAEHKAELVLGGTVLEAVCQKRYPEETDCLMQVRWELWDYAGDQVVYRAEVWGQFHEGYTNDDRALVLLVKSALDQLLQKPRFRQALTQSAPRPMPTEQTTFASYKACSAEPRPIEEDGSWAMKSVAIVRSGAGFGTAFLISDDPFLLTAAHVATVPRPLIRFQSGHETKASVIRIDRKADVALLRLDQAPPVSTCLPLTSLKDVNPGASVFALGNPRHDDFQFSLSRGVLSGIRTHKGVEEIQTDAPINPGNSGGPLVDAQGRALGIVSWKIAEENIEGLGFAVAVGAALERLHIGPGLDSDSILRQTAAITENEPKREVHQEPSETKPELDPDGRARREKRAKRYAKAPFTARYLVRITPSVGLAIFPKGGSVEVGSSTNSAERKTVDFGFSVSKTWSFGLHAALETRGAPLRACRECVLPYIQNLAFLGYDLGIGQLLVLRAKVGAGMEYDSSWNSVRAAWGAGLSAPIRLGTKCGLAALPFFEITQPFEDRGDESALALRVGLGFDIGLGNISKDD